MIVNGKEYPLWSQFVERKAEFIGGVLQDMNEGCPVETTIIDISLTPNGSDSAFFCVEGVEFNCGFDAQYGGITKGDDGWITISGYDNHIWRFKE